MDFLKYGPIKAIFAFFSLFILAPMAVSATMHEVEVNIARQNEHMAYLTSEYYMNYTPCDESRIASFDIEKAIDDGVKYNEVAFLGTHNSYQIESTDEFKKLYEAVDIMTYSIIKGETAFFNMDTLTEQLQAGIRSLEIDVETVKNENGISFVVCHNSVLDNTSSCYNFEKAIEEIKMWSDANPEHLPISIIIEPKNLVLPINGITYFDIEAARTIDNMLREKLGNTLLTPEEMMGTHESLKEMREKDGWLPLEETMGKIIVLLHDSDVTDDYIAEDETMKTQVMFPMLRYEQRNESYASFIIDNEPDQAIRHKKESIEKCKLIVRTRADSFPSHSESRYEKTDICGSQIISTDYPIRVDGNDGHVYSFNGYTVKLAN